MILLDTVLDKALTKEVIWNAIFEIAPTILPIIPTIITLIVCKSGIGFCYHILRNS